MLQICAAGPSLVQLLRPLFASFALPLFLSVHRVGQSVVLIAVIHGHGHGRFLSNLGHLLGLCVQIVPSAQQSQHQQYHDGGQHADDGIQFLGFLFHLRSSLRVAGVVVSGAVHALAGHHGVAVVRHRVHRADGRPVVGIRISARAGRQRGAVRDRRRRGHRAAPAPGAAVRVRVAGVVRVGVAVISRRVRVRIGIAAVIIRVRVVRVAAGAVIIIRVVIGISVSGVIIRGDSDDTTLQKYVKGRGMVNSSHAKWLRSVLTLHTGFLVSVPDCQDLLGPVYALLEARTASYSSVLQLRGKLDMIMKQKSGRCEDTVIDTEKEALVVHQDDSSDELSDVLEDLLVPMSDTDDNWDDDDINAEDTNNDDEDDEDEDDEDEVKLVNGGAKSDSNDEIEMDSD